MPSQTYEKLGVSDHDSDHISHESSESLLPRSAYSKRSNRLAVLVYIGSLLLGVVIGAVGLKFFETLSSQRKGDTTRTAAPSPVTHDVETQYHWQNFDGSFMNESIYRQAGSPEVDKAWEGLGVDYRSLVVPAELAEESGIDKDHVAINSKYGGGYPANVEGLHHLHCLNLVRQSLYYNIDYYRGQKKGAFENNDFVVRKHVSHCLDIIRQQLMCTIDVGVLGQVWWQPKDQPYPSAFVDFNTRHVCKNFDAIRSWAEARQMPPPEELPDDWLQPPRAGAEILDHMP